MRLLKFINESGNETLTPMPDDDVYRIAEVLKRDCNRFVFWLNILPNREFLYRGRYGNFGKKFFKLEARLESRKPMSTGPYYHERLNQDFVKKFGWKARNGVFVSSNHERASAYGPPMLFFPIGEYRFVWSPKFADLFVIISNLKWYRECKDEQAKESYWKDAVDFFYQTFGTKPKDAEEVYQAAINSYTDKDLGKAIKSGHEISFNCHEYYMVDLLHKDSLMRALLEK